jgi:hypothetical protein
MPTKFEGGINSFLGSRRQKSIEYTVHVKDVVSYFFHMYTLTNLHIDFSTYVFALHNTSFFQPYGEVDPFFAHKYQDELDDQWKLYADGHVHIVTWNRSIEQPRLIDGWTEIREHFELPFRYHLFAFAYYGDSMFHLLPCLTKELPTTEFPSFHSLSTAPKDPFSFEIVISNPGERVRELVEYSYIRTFIHHLY